MKTYHDAQKVIPVMHALLRWLAPVCTRLAVAGSLRRGKAEVSDIELVAQPAADKLEALLHDAERLRQIRQRRKFDNRLLSWRPRFKAFWWPPPVQLSLF